MFLICVSFQIVGCVILGYMAWVLATSITVSRFLSGTLVGRARAGHGPWHALSRLRKGSVMNTEKLDIQSQRNRL